MSVNLAVRDRGIVGPTECQLLCLASQFSVTGRILAESRYNGVPIEIDGASMISWCRSLVGRNAVAGIVFMLALVPIGMCQSISGQESEPVSSDPVEEIIVYGERSLVILRRELYTAEEVFLSKFNALNSTDKFDFECEYVVYLGHRRRNHVCTPKFAKKIEAAFTRDRMLSANWDANAMYSSRGKKNLHLLAEEMLGLIRTNSELQEAQLAVSKAKQAYQAEREKRR